MCAVVSSELSCWSFYWQRSHLCPPPLKKKQKTKLKQTCFSGGIEDEIKCIGDANAARLLAGCAACFAPALCPPSARPQPPPTPKTWRAPRITTTQGLWNVDVCPSRGRGHKRLKRYFFCYGQKLIRSARAQLNRQNESSDLWLRREVWEAKREDKGRTDTLGAPQMAAYTDDMILRAFVADGRKHLASERTPLFCIESRHFAF